MKFQPTGLILIGASLLLGDIPLGEASHKRPHSGEKTLRGGGHGNERHVLRIPSKVTLHPQHRPHRAVSKLLASSSSSSDGSESSESFDSSPNPPSTSSGEEESSRDPSSSESSGKDQARMTLRVPAIPFIRQIGHDKTASKTPEGRSISSPRTKGSSPMQKGQQANDGQSFKVKLRVPIPAERSGTGNAKKLIKSSSQRALDHYAKQYVAIDCEMVGVGPGGKRSILARVSVVDFFGEVIYDTFVEPTERVTDYRTTYSGVTRGNLENAPSFKTVQAKVKKLLEGKFLVGHAIDNDLQVLRLKHPFGMIRDTSLHPPFLTANDGKRPALRKLAKEHLGINIQQDPSGHDSVEDARVAMILYHQVLTAH